MIQYGLSDHNAAKHRWYYFQKMQMDEVLLFKQFDSDTALPGRMTFHTDFVDSTVRPDALERQSIEWRRRLPFHAERSGWDLSLVSESSEWMRDDALRSVLSDACS